MRTRGELGSTAAAPAMSGLPLASHYTGIFVRSLEREGYEVEALLEGSGISTARIADPKARITFDEHRAVVQNALRMTGDPALGLWFGKQLKLASLGLLGYAAMSSPTLGEAVLVISRFHTLRTHHLALHVDPAAPEEGRPNPTLRLEEMRDYGDLRVFLFESAMQCVAELSVIFLGTAPETLSFDMRHHEPAHWRDAEFPHPVRFGMPANRIHLGPSALTAPLPNAEAGTARAMEALLQAQLDTRTSRGPLQERVRRTLAGSFRRHDSDFPSATEVAEQLGYSPRTLRRELAAQGTGYRELADDVRCRLAIDALREGRLSVEEIGDRLGYRDKANFRRAFKRWTGRVPSDYRGA